MVPAEVRAIKEKASHLSSLTCEVGLTREVGSLAASLGVLQSSARPHSQRHTLGGSTYPSLRTSRGVPAPLAWALTALGHVLLLHLQARAGICRDSGNKMASPGPWDCLRYQWGHGVELRLGDWMCGKALPEAHGFPGAPMCSRGLLREGCPDSPPTHLPVPGSQPTLLIPCLGVLRARAVSVSAAISQHSE